MNGDDRDDAPVEPADSSGSVTGDPRSNSADGTTSGGIGSGAAEGTGGGAGNWDEPGGTGADDQKITYPAGTGAAAVGDWSSRLAGSGRDAPDEEDAGS